MKIEVSAKIGGANGGALVQFIPKSERALLPPGITDAEFSGAANAVLHSHGERKVFIGLGEAGKITAATLRSAAGTAVMFLRKIGHEAAMLDLSAWPQFAGPAIEGAVLGGYRFEKFKAAKTRPLRSLRCIVKTGDLAATRKEIKRAEELGNVTNYAREIANQPGNVLFPETLAEEARQIARKSGLRITVLGERELRAGGFGGMLAVGGGSIHPPRFIILEHRGGPASEPPIALVGKAITFDSGGISIKPAGQMEEMIFDKCGGMAVLGAMAGIAALKLKRNVVGIIASAENLPSATSYRPGDIVTAYDGKHIEIVNTDAEGRVVLADAIAYARMKKKAAAIIDLATLTGACGVALGDHAAGLWSTSDKLRDAVMAASEKTGERLWLMPLYSEYEEQIKSEVALVKNSGGRAGGACTAAAFLKIFAEDTPWAHLDIAYTASRERDQSHLARGATGYGVRLLIELIADWR